MAVFKYTARNADGKQMTGTVNAADRNGAVEQISARGLFPVDVTEEGRKASSKPVKSTVVLPDDAPRPRRRSKPKLRDLAT